MAAEEMDEGAALALDAGAPDSLVTGSASTSDINVARARLRRDLTPRAALAAEIAAVQRDLEKKARGPFRRLLAMMIGAAPTPEAVARFADKYPDRWAQAVSILGGLAGYERGVIELNIVDARQLSDSQLLARLAALQGEAPGRRVVEAEDAVILPANDQPVDNIAEKSPRALPSAPATGGVVANLPPILQQEVNGEPHG